ncbi:MAG TPA: peptidylprolyl isomerase, partial [Thermoanaerobaculia bacterium]|nr:peptidylprolyl isomerase [Thermoanaerobaculia bacterium]
GEKKTERIEAGDAYGEHRDDLVFSVSRDQMPAGKTPEVGDMLQVGFPDGSTATMKIAEIDDDGITLDANHPLAGQPLTFELELVAIDK